MHPRVAGLVERTEVTAVLRRQTVREAVVAVGQQLGAQLVAVGVRKIEQDDRAYRISPEVLDFLAGLVQ